MLKQGFCAVACLVLCLAGCGQRPAPLPITYPVHGRVTLRNGSPVVNGLVQFRSENDRSVVTSAVIQKDGAYSLVTTRSGLRAEGAVAGPHSVMVMVTPEPPVNQDGSPANAAPAMFTLAKPYIVEPHDNEFVLVVGQP
jgi:hypothetical protein